MPSSPISGVLGCVFVPLQAVDMTILRFSQAHPDIPPPAYAHPGDSGFDIRAAVPREGVWVTDAQVTDIPTGLRFEIPEGFELQIRPRSGLSASIIIANAPGTIDSGYRGELMVRLLAHPGRNLIVDRGMRIAQAVLAPVYRAELTLVDAVDGDTARGEGRFGSTGV